VRNAASEGVFRDLTEGDAYRLRQFTDPAALQSMLAMYEVKWLYVMLLAAAIPVFGMAGAGFAINAAAALLFSVSAWAWMSRHRLQAHAPLLVALFFGLGLPDMLRGTGPDFLTSALLMSGLMFWDRGRMAGAFLAMTLAVLARPDTAIFLGGFSVVMMLLRPQDALKASMALAFCGSAYVFATSAGHHIGWWPHFWFSTYHIQQTLEGFAPSFSITVYLTAVGYNVGRSLVEAAWPAFWLAGAVLAVYGLSRHGASGGEGVPFRLAVLLAAVLATVGKFMLFPLPENRLYTPHLYPALLLGGAWLLAHARAAAGRQAQG
jgi:hypothetical protein